MAQDFARACCCAHWMRETGVDDDRWAQMAVARPRSLTGRPLLEDGGLYVLVSRVQAHVDHGQRR